MVSDYDPHQTSDVISRLLTDRATEKMAPWSRAIEFEISEQREAATILTSMVGWPRGYPESVYDVLSIRSFDGDLPALCMSTLDGAGVDRKARSMSDLTAFIDEMLGSPGADEIFWTMVRKVERDYFTAGRSLRKSRETQGLQLGSPLRDNRGVVQAPLSISGLSGFVKIAAIKRLAAPPGETGSAFSPLEQGTYLAKLSLGSARVALTEAEVFELVNWARYIVEFDERSRQ